LHKEETILKERIFLNVREELRGTIYYINIRKIKVKKQLM